MINKTNVWRQNENGIRWSEHDKLIKNSIIIHLWWIRVTISHLLLIKNHYTSNVIRCLVAFYFLHSSCITAFNLTIYFEKHTNTHISATSQISHFFRQIFWNIGKFDIKHCCDIELFVHRLSPLIALSFYC